MRSRFIFGLTVSLLVIVPAAAMAQNPAIAGRVRDTSGAVLPGVTVEASSPALIERVRAAVTDGSGEYKIIDLRPGVYTVTFTITGFAAVKREGIELTLGFTANVNADLPLGTVAETITVSGATPLVDVQNVVKETVFTRAMIDALPTGLDYTSLASLVPGLIVNGAGSGLTDVGGARGRDGQRLSIHGGRPADMLLRFDGFPIGLLGNGGGQGSDVGVEPAEGYTEEVVFQTSNNSAETETAGVVMNYVPKAGGNTYVGRLFANFSNDHLQAQNLTDALRAKGLASSGGIAKLWNINPTMGGPIRTDRVWFFIGAQYQGADKLSTFYPPLNPATSWVYIPDTSQSAVVAEQYHWDVTTRLTWQASPRNRLAAHLTFNRQCDCNADLGNVTTPAASGREIEKNFPLAQVAWTAPVTGRLLLEAGVQVNPQGKAPSPQPYSVGPGATDLANGFIFRGNVAGSSRGYSVTRYRNNFMRFASSYVTGAHAAKVGVQLWPGRESADYYSTNDINYFVTLLSGVPQSVTFKSTPFTSDDYSFRSAAFAQDQWTHKHLTVNAGVRFDSLNTRTAAYHLAPTNILPARDFPGQDVLRWRDVSPRFGVAYDLSGNGKTAIKASVGRYVVAEGTGLTRNADPTIGAGGTLTRNWTDINHDFIPQGDPLNPVANGELGPSPNTNFGKAVFSTVYDPAWANGWGTRPFNWEASAIVEHEIVPRVSMTAGYFRRIYGNFTIINNQRQPTDYTPYCITAPADPRLPAGGGQSICGLFDITPAAQAQPTPVNITTRASNFGKQYEHNNAVDVTMQTRLAHGLMMQFGVSTYNTITDNCDVVSKNPQLIGAGVPLDYCHSVSKFTKGVKANASYALPWHVDIAAVYENTAVVGANPTPFGYVATYVASRALILPSLGRNLSTNSVNINIVRPGSVYGDRLNRVDLRLARTFTFAQRRRLKAMLDVFNLTNGNPVTLLNTTYGTNGASWLSPLSILAPRFAKIGVQIDF